MGGSSTGQVSILSPLVAAISASANASERRQETSRGGAELWETLSGARSPGEDSAALVDVSLKALPILFADPLSVLIHLLSGSANDDGLAAHLRLFEAALVLRFVQAALRLAFRPALLQEEEPMATAADPSPTSDGPDILLWMWAVEKVTAAYPSTSVPGEWRRIRVHLLAEVGPFVKAATLLLAAFHPDEERFAGLSLANLATEPGLRLLRRDVALDSIVNWDGSPLSPSSVDVWWSSVAAALSVPTLKDWTSETQLWGPPRLLRLPSAFDELFQRFTGALCPKCRTAPKKTLLCLVCGGLVCGEGSCCASLNLHEAEYHALSCGAGTAIFLCVQTSMVTLVRDKKTAIWGSLYLDAHGEEDNKLRRGKPLRLSSSRLALLERQWRERRLERASRRWQFLPPPAPPHNPPEPPLIVL